MYGHVPQLMCSRSPYISDPYARLHRTAQLLSFPIALLPLNSPVGHFHPSFKHMAQNRGQDKIIKAFTQYIHLFFNKKELLAPE